MASATGTTKPDGGGRREGWRAVARSRIARIIFIWNFAGLAVLIVGNGLFKPNISTMVGSLYRPTDERRDAGFSIFYMGINIGAFLSPLVTGYLAQSEGWKAKLTAKLAAVRANDLNP